MCMENNAHSHSNNCCKQKTSYCGHGCCNHEQLPNLSEYEKELLRLAAKEKLLPVGRFLLKSSRSSHLEAVAYSPVYITDKLDDMSTVHTNARFLNRLQEHGLVTLNYDEPLESYDYEFFYESSAYEYFTETVREGKQNQGFIFDTAIFELGHIALTGSGQDLATSL